ncbi:hypothetical protein LMH87_001074 [Akanthomyces muscarius]|uniref:Uncharacterized protein n=1 Tax=Akanthomyces muscarius TaxID=2231603 RepID=A0A9W8QJ59_AKAMU|nr:hypothetical protein LMH87_001074 [Akanthomyces muscarius]KAJ4155848.1 hypothetical protein LMH87_001074 [Akanthomyces muscarius]
MGGSAFSVGASPLCTPRMPPRIYHAQKQRCEALLRQLYVHVDSPIDGPGKTDFGDVDFLVFQRREDAPVAPPHLENTKPASELIHEVATLLGSERTIVTTGAASNLAIPWPADQVSETDTEQPRYIQVDVRISPSLESHRWMLFKHAHGDIWNLVGSLVRPYGLTIDDTGMFIRIPEVEAVYKARAKVHLTSDPDRVLDFLGLPRTGDYARIWVDEPFVDLDAMFEYVTHCRMMYITPSATGPPDQANHDEGHNLLKDVQNLKHNDRQRMRQRPGFRRWIEEFVPRCRREGRFTVQGTSRGRITDEALEQFGVGEEFERRRREFLLEKQRDYIWNGIIKTEVPGLEPGETDQQAITARACLVKGLKRIILERDASYGVEFDEDMVGEDGFYKLDEVRRFIERHKDEVREAAMVRQHAAFMESLEKKSKAKLEKAEK